MQVFALRKEGAWRKVALLNLTNLEMGQARNTRRARKKIRILDGLQAGPANTEANTKKSEPARITLHNTRPGRVVGKKLARGATVPLGGCIDGKSL